MNRRNFLQLIIGGLAASIAVRTWPFRVYSFPTEVTLAPTGVFENLYLSGQSKNFAQLLAPGLRHEFLKWFKSTNPEEYQYGLLGKETFIGGSGREDFTIYFGEENTASDSPTV